MRRAIVVHGRLTAPRHVELDEDVAEVGAPVEVIVSPSTEAAGEDVFEFIAALPGGHRSKDEIDRQVREERDWGTHER